MIPTLESTPKILREVAKSLKELPVSIDDKVDSDEYQNNIYILESCAESFSTLLAQLKRPEHEHKYNKVVYHQGVRFMGCSHPGCNVIDLEQ